MRILRKPIIFALALVILALPTALCEGGIAVMRITAPANLDLLMIDDYELELGLSPSSASVGDVVFSVGKSKQISVDEAGRITPLKSGSAVLTINAKTGGASAKCNVRVFSEQDAAKEVLKLVNAQRKSAKQKALKLDDKLCKAAAERASEMEALFSHTRPDGRAFSTAFDEQKLSYGYKGENIAAGQTTPSQVMNDWLNSQGHRENILYPNFTHMGLGIAKTQTGSICWVQVFGGK